MKIKGGNVWLKWDDGKERKIGRIDIEGHYDEARMRIRKLHWLFGWELVRKGLWMMFHWTRDNEEELTDAKRVGMEHTEGD